jgi:hypothetical protein
MISQPAIPRPKSATHAWQLCRSIDRPSPPDLSREKHDGIGTAIKFIVGCNNSHLAQQLIWWQNEKGCDARILHGCQSEASILECSFESPRQRSTDTAITVEADPAPRSPAALTVSYF